MSSYLKAAHRHAVAFSKCAKVVVGSCIVLDGAMFFGANRVIPDCCNGGDICNRILPHDGLPHCVSTIHSEVDAIIRAKRDLTGATIYVTRYPCENCARVIVTAGIKHVIYGRPQEISEDTKKIFESARVFYTHLPLFNPEGER